MGASSDKEERTDKIHNFEEIKKIPNDQYTCTECALVPEILNIDYEYNQIEFKCKTHGTKKVNLREYFIESSQYSYFSFKCAQCNKTQKDFIVENQNSIEENKSFYNDIIFNSKR